MRTVSRLVILKSGEQCRLFERLSWQQRYYSLDHETTWHSTKKAALEAARNSGLLAVIGRPVELPNGLIAIAQ